MPKQNPKSKHKNKQIKTVIKEQATTAATARAKGACLSGKYLMGGKQNPYKEKSHWW